MAADAHDAGTSHFDVLVVGAGLSGIGAGHRLMTRCPGRSFALLEARSAIGGTWDLFRFPGVRSDSDMFTLCYPFRPWHGASSISDGDSILQYIRNTASETGIADRVLFRHRVISASWDSATTRWTLRVTVDAGQPAERDKVLTCSFLYLCCGYFRYDHGHAPQLAGIEHFEGTVVHPQSWPERLDASGKQVVVVGSGATAVTLVPELAREAAHVTMLQRSPGYMVSLPSKDPAALWLRDHLPEQVAFRMVRWKNILVSLGFYLLCRTVPHATRRRLLAMVRGQLPDGYPVEVDFSPRYKPWDERLCVVSDGDLFESIRDGSASVSTGAITTFTASGVSLDSGEEIPADIVVSATGLELLAFGGIELSVDDATVDPGRTFLYRGFMLGGVPNLAVCMGYTNASWTLRADLVSRNLCRLLNDMDRRRMTVVTPPKPPRGTPELPLLGLKAGYVTRSAREMPKRTRRGPWRLRQNYPADVVASRIKRISAGLSLSTSRVPGRRPDGSRRAGAGDGTSVRPGDVLGDIPGEGGQIRTSESSVPKSLAT
jgi:cation diffusion facilitator CzcD-associated flavoprotein CzcO